MKLNQQLVKINRNFLVCFIVSAVISAMTSQSLADYESHFNTTITIVVGYIVFFAIFGTLFFFDNKIRYKTMKKSAVREELIKLATSFGIGEVFYLGIRWFSLYYFLELDIEPFFASLSSEIISTGIYMVVVSIFLKTTKTF